MKTLDRSSVATMLDNFALLALTQHPNSAAAAEVALELNSAAEDMACCIREHAIGSGIESYAFARAYMLFCRLWIRKDLSHAEVDRQLFLWTHQRQISICGEICFKRIPLDAYRSLLWILDQLAEDVVWRQLFDSSVSTMEV
jgi:hypothetical protein